MVLHILDKLEADLRTLIEILQTHIRKIYSGIRMSALFFLLFSICYILFSH